MKRIIRSALIICLCAALPLLKAAAQGTAKAGAEADIAAIRASFKKINELSLTKEQFKYEVSGCAEDGTVQYFLNEKEIVKVIESGSIGDGSWTREFYYQSGKFIFSYEALVGGPAIGPETKTEYRIYVKNDQLVRYMEDKKIITTDSRIKETIATAYKLIKAYSTKDFSGALCGQ